MDDGSSGRADVPPLRRRRDPDRRPDQYARAAFRFFDFPKTFKIFADHLDAAYKAGSKRHTHGGNQIDGVASD